MGGDAFITATVITSSTLQCHYEINAPTGNAPTLDAELSSTQGVPSLAYPGIPDPYELIQLPFSSGLS